MENIEINPFQQLYVSETTLTSDFVMLFSPYLVQHFPMLFQTGNVILRGTQGSGKTMLLNLLKPDTRIAYYRADTPFPVKKSINDFISAGINLTRSDAVGFGQRPIVNSVEIDRQLFPLYFADFINYWVVMDLLDSIDKVKKYPGAFGELVNFKNLDNFACKLSIEDCWFGYFHKTKDYQHLIRNIKERINIYRLFNQFNIERIPDKISRTKTSIGEPISRAAVCLKESGVIKPETSVFIRIDQLEFLLESEEIRDDLGHQYRHIINKALSTRDPAISYKIGTRTYAWSENLRIYGTDHELEYRRDYNLADLDETLRRKENPSTWILPAFAQDVFKRRLLFAGYEDDLTKSSTDTIKLAFGDGLEPIAAAKRYCRTSDPKRALRISEALPKTWQSFLIKNFSKNPLNMKLASAWVLQQGAIKSKNRRSESPPPSHPPWPWERLYWKKERVRQALLQLSAHCQQRMYWAGKEQLLALSGNNILIFISICQHIWDVFLRAERGKSDKLKSHPLKESISSQSQSVGIYSASTYWYNKISEQPGGHKRKRFVDYLGRLFRDSLVDDHAMSYPGHNGFSISNDELENGEPTYEFIKQAVNYGVLSEAAHTTKTRDRRKRTKWYLNPVYSPHFGIPETHIKEPIYVLLKKVSLWLKESERPKQYKARSTIIISDVQDDPEAQLKLFDQ